MKQVELFGYKIFENGTILALNGKPMKFNKTITLSVNKKLKKVSYARFVYYAFNKDFDFNNHSYCVKHKDNDFSNNNINNLYITNKKEDIRGENHKMAKLTDKQVEEIKELYRKGQEKDRDINTNSPNRRISYRKLADKYGVSHNLIRGIIKGNFRNKNN